MFVVLLCDEPLEVAALPGPLAIRERLSQPPEALDIPFHQVFEDPSAPTGEGPALLGRA